MILHAHLSFRDYMSFLGSSINSGKETKYGNYYVTANPTHEVGALPVEDAKVSGESEVESYNKAR